MRSEGYGTWCVCVCVSVRSSVFSDYTQRHNETAIPTDSSLNWLHFLKRRFSYNYCVQKLWREKQAKKLMSTRLPRRYGSDL